MLYITEGFRMKELENIINQLLTYQRYLNITLKMLMPFSTEVDDIISILNSLKLI